MGDDVVRVTAEGQVAELLLNRPDKLNALSPAVLEALIAAAAELDGRRDVKVVIVRGAGRAFSGGADLGAMGGGTLDALDLGRRAIDAVAGMRALTIAAIHGHCVGGALVLATACDLRLAAVGTRFAIPEVDLGMPLTWGGIPRLTRELGPALTKELVLTCRPFDADEALRMRFVNRVVAEGDLLDAARSLATKLASQPAYALTLTKRQVDAVAEEAGSTAQAFREAELLLAAAHDPESQQAMQRYLEARS
jgi:enoyl-CoA hydratase/carnithine racemase